MRPGPRLLALVMAWSAACGAPTASAPAATTLPASPAVDTRVPAATGTAAPANTPGPTPERRVVLTADLAAEVTNEDRTASGSATIVFELQRDGERITAATAQFAFSLKGLPSDARVQFAHIHLGAGAFSDPIVLDSGLTAARFRFTNGEGSISLPPVQCDPALAAKILADPGVYFFRVHSARNPDGFVRGQLKRA